LAIVPLPFSQVPHCDHIRGKLTHLSACQAIETPTETMTLTSVITIEAKARKKSELSALKFSLKTTNNNTEEYLSQYVYKLPEDYNALECFSFFKGVDNARTYLGWTTGPKLFTNFRMLLSDCPIAEDTFESEAAQSATETVATFNVAYAGFKSAMLTELRHDDQLEYMRTLQKPSSLTVREFLQRLKTLNSLSKRFPDAPQGQSGLNDSDLKRCFHNAMPATWQKTYSTAGFRYVSQTLDHVYQYMVTQEQSKPLPPPAPLPPTSPAVNRRNRSGNADASNTSGDTTERNTPVRNGRNNRRIQPEDTCPLPGHGNHRWYDCRLNAQGRHHDNTHRPTGSLPSEAAPSSSTTASGLTPPDTTTSNPEVHFLEEENELGINTFEFAKEVDELEAENY